MPTANYEIELPNSCHIVTCRASGKLIRTGDGFNEPREEYIEDIDVDRICWQRTGRPVKIAYIVEVVTELACKKLEEADIVDDYPDPPDPPDPEDYDDDH
jgi:hypothetical protein